MIKVISHSLVYRNPAPHLRSVHAWHPSLVHLGGQRWVCSFDLAQAPEAHDYRTHVSHSDDDGATWSAPVPLVLPEDHPGAVSLRISRLSDGRIVGFGALMDVRPADQGIFNPANFGYTAMRLGFAESLDDGRTWAPPRPLDLPLTGTAFETCHPIRELADGRLLAPTCTLRTWEGSAPYGMKAVAFVSYDGGAAWPEWLDVRDDSAQDLTNWEQSIVELSGGRLVGATWRYSVDDGTTAPTELIAAADGRTFVSGGPTGFFAQTTKLLALPDDRVLALYRRHDQPGLWASLAQVDAATPRWETLETVKIWDGASSGMASGVEQTKQLSELRFGYPSPALRPDGDVEVAYWRRVEEINEVTLVRLHIGD